jgi:exodeoxyribonuclease V alpha subunit
MHGGIKVYRGTAAAARNYLDADRSRADDYYLAEGTGVARRFTASPDGGVVELTSLTGDGYEAWVAGVDPDSGEPRGRVRADASAVRFVEVIVNGPKSWSLAAELHPDVAATYEVAQDRAAEQVIQWLGQHATTRVGPRGAQVAIPVERLEAVTVRHHSSRAGDPHRHLHLQVNARGFAAGKWRGIDTVAVRDSIHAINGIGHAAAVCDPQFRAALTAHGYTLNRDGEIEQLAQYVAPFSHRAAQIGDNIARYETAWRGEHPGEQPGPAQWRAWDARAWADARPDKVTPEAGADLHARWLGELAALGYRDQDKPIQLALLLSGQLDRDAAVAEVIGRLGARRSAWNAADVRGETEQLLARTGVVADAAVRLELAEDITARALVRCVRLLGGSTPEHIRVLTSQSVLDVEADLVARLAARGAHPVARFDAALVDSPGLDAGQQAAAAVLAGDARLVVVQGAAGAGKTTTLAVARHALAAQGRRLMIVTPTLKAAQTASAEVGTRAGSAAWLAYQYGCRWDASGTWTRQASEPPPDAALRRGDLLLVDEAGMLDQDTARALLTIADETGARLALVGDRHQLPAVGRGGLLELADRWADPAARVELDLVHRFVRRVDGARVPDRQYAALSLAMRAGDDPAEVFDALLARSQIRLHASAAERAAALAHAVVAELGAGVDAAVVVDTREQVAMLTAAIRDRLVAFGQVDDARIVTTSSGHRIGRGDLIVTRYNDHDLGVANRDSWRVTRVHRDGRLRVIPARAGVTPHRRAREAVLPSRYVREHVELGYATTAHGVQGDTSTTAHLDLGEHTTAASAYVAMTRGRESNTTHLVAADIDDAREQWVTAFSRDRADLGPAAASEAAQRVAAGYTQGPRPDDPAPLAHVLDQLRGAWNEQHAAHRQLQRLRERLELVQAEAAWETRWASILAPLDAERDVARAAAQQAGQAADGCAATLAESAELHAARLRQVWDAQLPDADNAACALARGAGRLGVRSGRVRDAHQHLERWTASWMPVFADTDLDPRQLADRPLAFPSNVPQVAEALYRHAHRLALAEHPDQVGRLAAARRASHRYAAAAATCHEARRELEQAAGQPVYDTGAVDLIPDLTDRVDAARQRVTDADERVAGLSSDLAITGQPDPASLLAVTRAAWQAEQVAEHQHRAFGPRERARSINHEPHPPQQVDLGPSIGR